MLTNLCTDYRAHAFNMVQKELLAMGLQNAMEALLETLLPETAGLSDHHLWAKAQPSFCKRCATFVSPGLAIGPMEPEQHIFC